MNILAIETSCDDTCVAIVEADKRGLQRGFTRIKFSIFSNIVSSQVKIHRKWGGVYPTLAKREHQKNLPVVLKKALKGAKLLKKKVDLIAVTVGPGLEPCLWVGVNFAKALSQNWNLPIIPINHIEAHIFANFVGECQISNVKCQMFPAVCLVVSGGHTQLILMKDYGKYKILGETRDDAAGECFDKIARILGFGYPGGPSIAKQASQLKLKIKNEKLKIILPRPMIYQKNYDFSFSGLKTAVLYNYRSQPVEIKKSKQYIQKMAAEAQQAVIDVLIRKTIRAAKEYKVKTVMLGGGVAANEELRKQFKKRIKKELPNIQYLIPNIQFCTDNAVMVGVAGYFQWLKEEVKNWRGIEADANLRLE